MSIELHVFLEDSRVPSRDTWQQTIERLGFPVELDTTLDVRSDTGFSPTTFRSKQTGFEFYLEPAEEVISTYTHLSTQVGDRDRCATFRWGSDLDECGAAISAAAALTSLSDGIYYYPDDDMLYMANEVVEATKSELESIP